MRPGLRPPRLVVSAYFRRGAVVWLTMRLVVGVVCLFAGLNPLEATAGATLGFAGLAAGLTVFDLHRRHERILIGNLGVSTAFIAGIATVPALIGETLLLLAYAAIQ
jgi:hypothetical protein